MSGAERREQRELAGERAHRDRLRERVAVAPGGVAAAADAEDVQPCRLRREPRPAADGPDLEARERHGEVQVALGRRLRVVIAFAPSTTWASSCPVARNIAATALATWALKPSPPAFAEPTRFFRVLISAIDSGVVWSRSSTTSRGTSTSAATERPRPSTALIAAGFLSEQRFPESATSEASVSASISSQASRVAMVTMFIPIASFVS